MRSWNEAPAARARRNGQLCGVCGCRKRTRGRMWCADIERARRWAGELTCNAIPTGKLSAVACAAKESTNCQRCIPLVGLRQRRRLAVHLLLERLRVFRRELDSYYVVHSAEPRECTTAVGAPPCGRPRPCDVPQVDLTQSDRKCQIFTTYTCHESRGV